MSKIVTTFSERLKESLNLKNIKAIELAQLSGISRGAISSYLSGRWKAKQDNIYLLAKALNVNEAWLMGYDVPMESVRPQSNYTHSSPPHIYLREPNHIELKPITYPLNNKLYLLKPLHLLRNNMISYLTILTSSNF